jgi:signal peptidase II
MATKGKTRWFAARVAACWPWLGLALVLLIADQFTKVLILGYYQLGDSTVVTSLSSTRARAQHRRGVLLPGLGRWLAALVLSPRWAWRPGFIVWMLRAHPRNGCSASPWPASWAARWAM